MPVAFEDMLIEEFDAAVAETHGRRGEVVNVLAVQAVGLKLGFGDQVWGCAKELGEQSYLTDGSLLGTLSFATELESRNHLFAQRGHERPSFLS
jgi:hypothetical protein